MQLPIQKKLYDSGIEMDGVVSASASLVSQGTHRFYSLTLDTEHLTATCAATARKENPIAGFQRLLDSKRAKEIADYVDAGGVIPSSIILSSQESAEFKYDSKKKLISFKKTPGAFLIIDGQHRLFGFSMATVRLRVPVIIFTDLTLREEAKLFIDINTLQRPVPPELLMDIRNMAIEENETQSFIRDLFDKFNTEEKSILKGLLTSSEKSKGKISRPSFSRGVKPIIPQILENELDTVFETMNSYFIAIKDVINFDRPFEYYIAIPNIFAAFVVLFPQVTEKVTDRYGKNRVPANYSEVIKSWGSLKPANILKAKSSYKNLSDTLIGAINKKALAL
jgi:DGQHR domain-containing protein